jgi:hypothetical protein
MDAVLRDGFMYTKHNFWCQPTSMVRHYGLYKQKRSKGWTENKKERTRKAPSDLKYKENKIRKTGCKNKKETVPSCTRNQTQNLQEESVPLLLAF